MKLDRNIPGNGGRGKYALLLIRRLTEIRSGNLALGVPIGAVEEAVRLLDSVGAIDWGEVGSDGEFFLIRLKDAHAGVALSAYAMHATASDLEYARDVLELAQRAGKNHPGCKMPD
jgi:hypothetical protein